MNAHDRFLAALGGEYPCLDHTPIWLLFPYHPTTFYVDVRNNSNYSQVIKMVEKYGITLNRRCFARSVFAPEVEIKETSYVENGEQISRREFYWNGSTLFAEMRVSSSTTTVKKMLNSAEDIEWFCSLPIENNKDRLYRQLDEWRLNYEKERQEFPPELGCMMLDLGEPIHILYSESNLEELSIASILPETNQKIIDFLSRLQEHFKIVYQYCADNKLAEVYFMVGSELAAPPMFSERTFTKWVVPFSKELIDIAHKSKAKVIQHFHGQIKSVLPYFVEMGADALHTIEAPPIGNCTLTEAFDIVGGKLTLIGNIQYDDFRSMSQDEMREAVKSVLNEAKGHRFILSPTAGPFDENPGENFIKNYLTFMETAWNYQTSLKNNKNRSCLKWKN